MLATATEHYVKQQQITVDGLRDVTRATKRKGVSGGAEILAAWQVLAARESVAATPRMLAEQDVPDAPAAVVRAESVAGTAADGRTLVGLLEQFEPGSYGFGVAVVTTLQDTARNAAGLTVAARPGVGYVRMLNPPSCSRCVVLAGKFYRWNSGFERHPKCDCRHIPASEDTGEDLRTDPTSYFDSLSQPEQDRVFTQSGAQAIRDGADMAQVVNSRRGGVGLSGGFGRLTAAERELIKRGRLQSVDVYGRQTFVTSEGTTRRGVFGRSDQGGRQGFVDDPGGRYKRAARARIMPETIYQVATSQADAIRLLKLYRYIY